jgi:hypothetical protein
MGASNYFRRISYMAINFNLKDIMHKVLAKFVPARLPESKKQYNLKASPSTDVDIHGLASKAEVYGITTPPSVIEEGMETGFALMRYLVADGYTVRTPLMTVKIRFPGEYDGTETRLPDGVVPEPGVVLTPGFRSYIAEKVTVQFDGFFVSEGIIGSAVDEDTGRIDSVATIGRLLTIHGVGLKIGSDEAHKAVVGVFFYAPSTGNAVKATIVPVNEPKMLKVIVPALDTSRSYRIRIATQLPVSGGGKFLKELRNIESDFALYPRTAPTSNSDPAPDSGTV